MPQRLSLRQIEGFLAIMEAGTVNGAAGLLNISQPAVSKLVAHLEADSGMALFERRRGRLVPTRRGLQLHAEALRIFGGLHQLERAMEQLKREDGRQLHVGVIAALSGVVVHAVIADFMATQPDVYFSIQTGSSDVVCGRIIDRSSDVGLVSTPTMDRRLVNELILRHPLVCVMPNGHPLAERRVIEPPDLDGVPFLAFQSNSQTHTRIASLFDQYGVREQVVLDASTSTTICEFVAGGHGVSLMHPLLAAQARNRVVVRRFEPEINIEFFLCHAARGSENELVTHFSQSASRAAEAIAADMLAE